MPILPQLKSGAGVQFPIHRKLEHRTIRNTLEDNSEIRFSDSGAISVSWQLTYVGMTDEEVRTLQTFFEKVEGRLYPFTFFDPIGNLLGWSEDLDQPAWQHNTLLTLNTSIEAPDGSQRANRFSNSSGADLSLGQEVSLPGSYASCFSFYARSDYFQQLTVSRSSGSAGINHTVQTTTTWKRYVLTSTLDSGGDTSLFTISFPSETSTDIFGLQVEAQPFPSSYIPSFSRGAIYTHSRFDLDSISFTATGFNQSTCTLRIISPLAH